MAKKGSKKSVPGYFSGGFSNILDAIRPISSPAKSAPAPAKSAPAPAKSLFGNVATSVQKAVSNPSPATRSTTANAPKITISPFSGFGIGKRMFGIKKGGQVKKSHPNW